MTGFGTTAQRDAYITLCLAGGASAEAVADHLGIDVAEVRAAAHATTAQETP